MGLDQNFLIIQHVGEPVIDPEQNFKINFVNRIIDQTLKSLQ